MSEDKKIIYKIRDLTLNIFDFYGNKSQRISYGSFDICGGDFVIIKGRNGSGKSTLFHLLALTEMGYFNIESGAAIYNAKGFPDTSVDKYGVDMAAALRREIVYIGQEEKFLSWHSAYDALYSQAEIAVAEKYSGLLGRQKRVQIHRLIEGYFNDYIKEIFKCKDFKEFRKRKVTSYSGGQMKMLNVLSGIIKAKVCESPLIIMDEPLNNLDGKNKYYLNKIFSEFRNDSVAMLIITHCQIFDGINRVISITDCGAGEVKAEITDISVPPHRDCLEAFGD